MDIIEIFRLSQEAIFANKLRSALTALGIIIGVAAIILLISIGSGIQSYVSAEFEKLGSNSMFIAPGKFQISQGGAARVINKLTFKTAENIERQKGPYITSVIPYIEITATAAYRTNNKITTLVGGSSGFLESFGFTLGSGRPFTESEDKTSKKVAVIGSTIAKDFYKNENPIGKKITISKKTFTVIGILRPQGSVGGLDADNFVAVPLNSARAITGSETVTSIIVKTASSQTVPQAKTQVEKILLKTLTEDDFTIMSQEQLLSSVTQILGFITVALGGIAAISLIVGGVGISNIMLVSVTERTKEIGLRKAVGARPRDILSQFLIEAIILSLSGGVVGLLLGYFGSLALSTFIRTTIPLWSVLLALGFSSLVGIVFGVFPAYRASKLDPIVALRYE